MAEDASAPGGASGRPASRFGSTTPSLGESESDRALLHARADAVVGVLLRDSEVMDALPVESFDRPVGLIVTEARTIRTPYLAE